MQEPVFETYSSSHLRELDQVSKLLSEELSDDPEILQSQARSIEAWNGRLGVIVAWADSYLDMATADRIRAKEKGETDLDRQTKLDAAVARERRFRDVAQSLLKAIDRRVSLAQSLIRAQSEARSKTAV